MNDYFSGKKYESAKIPDREQVQQSRSARNLQPKPADSHAAPADGLFYVIDYDLSEIPGTGKFVLKSQKIEPPASDPIRERFQSMRELARTAGSPYFSERRFYQKDVRQDNARIFYRQGIFMQDFSDTYAGDTPFSSYYPYYQLMSHEQLRTYFSWRTEVRQGNIRDIPLSYAFLYIYELLCNIGVADPQDGLDRLLFFWQAFRVHNRSIDKYVLRWLKDYHIYYPLPQTFSAFVREKNLSEYYPPMPEADNDFALFCAISKYDICKSAFYKDDNCELIADCFRCVINTLRQELICHGISFDDSLFQPAKKTGCLAAIQGCFVPSVAEAGRQENRVFSK